VRAEAVSPELDFRKNLQLSCSGERKEQNQNWNQNQNRKLPKTSENEKNRNRTQQKLAGDGNQLEKEDREGRKG
jgi:hypothetical protein